MAAELDEEVFKTTLMGGFDKEDVMTKFREAREEAETERKKLEGQIAERDKLIDELRQSVKSKEAEIEQLQKNIKEKYQSYIDNYDSIGKLVFDAKVRAENMTAETKQKCEKMLRETKEECARLVKEAREKEEEVVAVYEAKIEQQAQEAQQFMEQQMTQGRNNYRMVQTEMIQIIRAMDELQRGFLESYKKVHAVKDAMDRSSQKMEPFFRELQVSNAREAGKAGASQQEDKKRQTGAPGARPEPSKGRKGQGAGNKEKTPEEEGFLDEGMDFDDELEVEIHRLLKDEDESEEGGQG